MSKILNLLNENEYWYYNDDWTGSSLEKNYQEAVCYGGEFGVFEEWIGTRYEGEFEDFVIKEVTNCVYRYFKKEYVGVKYGLVEYEEKEYFILTEHNNVDDFVSLLIVDEDFWENSGVNEDSIILNIEGELHTEKISNLSEDLIKEAIQRVVVVL